MCLRLHGRVDGHRGGDGRSSWGGGRNHDEGACRVDDGQGGGKACAASDGGEHGGAAWGAPSFSPHAGGAWEAWAPPWASCGGLASVHRDGGRGRGAPSGVGVEQGRVSASVRCGPDGDRGT